MVGCVEIGGAFAFGGEVERLLLPVCRTGRQYRGVGNFACHRITCRVLPRFGCAPDLMVLTLMYKGRRFPKLFPGLCDCLDACRADLFGGVVIRVGLVVTGQVLGSGIELPRRAGRGTWKACHRSFAGRCIQGYFHITTVTRHQMRSVAYPHFAVVNIERAFALKINVSQCLPVRAEAKNGGIGPRIRTVYEHVVREKKRARGHVAKGERIAADVDDLHSASVNVNKQTTLSEKGQVINGRGDKPNRHDILTGSRVDGGAFGPGDADMTCGNWTKGGADGSVMMGHHDRSGTTSDPWSLSWNSSHMSRGGCSQKALIGTGGDGLFYCFAAN